MAAEMIAGESIANATISDLESMAKLAEKESLKRKFVPGNDENKQVANKSRAVVTDAEINIDDVFSDDIISERAIPAAVYGLAIPANGSQ